MNSSYQRSLWVIHWILIQKSFLVGSTFILWWIVFSHPWQKPGYPEMCHRQTQSENHLWEHLRLICSLSLYFYMYHCVSKRKFWRNMAFISFFQLLQYLQFCSQKLRLHWLKSSLLSLVTIKLWPPPQWSRGIFLTSHSIHHPGTWSPGFPKHS